MKDIFGFDVIKVLFVHANLIIPFPSGGTKICAVMASSILCHDKTSTPQLTTFSLANDLADLLGRE